MRAGGTAVCYTFGHLLQVMHNTMGSRGVSVWERSSRPRERSTAVPV
eukprot:COSAG06_NODE_55326_length_290_cov_0.790576_1_plen_46_part_01